MSPFAIRLSAETFFIAFLSFCPCVPTTQPCLASKKKKKKKIGLEAQAFNISSPSSTEWRPDRQFLTYPTSGCTLGAEAELHALISAAADGIYITGRLSFLTGPTVKHYILVDNMAARMLANKRGVGRIRHLSGKLLWIQGRTAGGDIIVIQVSTDLNIADLGTKPLTSGGCGFRAFRSHW